MIYDHIAEVQKLSWELSSNEKNEQTTQKYNTNWKNFKYRTEEKFSGIPVLDL